MEADRVAIGRVASLGFDPGALARYLGRVQPKLTERIAAAEAAARDAGPVTISVESGDFDRIQRLLRPAPRPAPSLLHK